jgi:hypothetical protein
MDHWRSRALQIRNSPAIARSPDPRASYVESEPLRAMENVPND